MARDEGYLDAERRIDEARQAEATELDLRGLELTEVPEAIASLKQLQTLNLSYNQLTELPEAIASLTQLQMLNLSYNQLTKLPEAIASLTQLQSLNLSYNQLTKLPEAIASLTQLQSLNLSRNQLTELPEAIASLEQLQSLDLSRNQLIELPNSLDCFLQLKEIDCGSNPLKQFPPVLRELTNLRKLLVYDNQIEMLPSWISELHLLEMLSIGGNQILELPNSLETVQSLNFLILGADTGGNPLIEFPRCIRGLSHLKNIWACNCELKTLPDWLDKLAELEDIALNNNFLTDLPTSLGLIPNLEIKIRSNPLNPDLAAANDQGIEAVMQYLRAKAEGEVALNEAKLILVGEGEVGKSCLLGALRGDPWVDGRPTTHGIEIKSVIVTAPDSTTKITLNGWDFGGQRVYRPTHQLFFSAPAVYLVVWKPREGPQQGFVKEWITLIKHREPEAKVLVVATHGGPGQRQPDIDRQELIDLFGSDTVVDFFHVDSKPNAENQYCHGIAELREAIP